MLSSAAMFSPFFYKFVHIVALGLLIGYTFHAFAAPAGTRARVLLITGVSALLLLVSGFALMHKTGYAWLGWAWVKLACWAALGALGGIAYRHRALVPRLKLAATALLALGVYMAVYKPAIW